MLYYFLWCCCCCTFFRLSREACGLFILLSSAWSVCDSPLSRCRHSTQVRKLQERVQRAKEEVQRTKEKYEAALQEINSYNPKYMEDMQEVFDKCQQMEAQRLTFFKEVLFNIHKGLNISQDPTWVWRVLLPFSIPNLLLAKEIPPIFDGVDLIQFNCHRRWSIGLLYRFSLNWVILFGHGNLIQTTPLRLYFLKKNRNRFFVVVVFFDVF